MRKNLINLAIVLALLAAIAVVGILWSNHAEQGPGAIPHPSTSAAATAP